MITQRFMLSLSICFVVLVSTNIGLAHTITILLKHQDQARSDSESTTMKALAKFPDGQYALIVAGPGGIAKHTGEFYIKNGVINTTQETAKNNLLIATNDEDKQYGLARLEINVGAFCIDHAVLTCNSIVEPAYKPLVGQAATARLGEMLGDTKEVIQGKKIIRGMGVVLTFGIAEAMLQCKNQTFAFSVKNPAERQELRPALEEYKKYIGVYPGSLNDLIRAPSEEQVAKKWRAHGRFLWDSNALLDTLQQPMHYKPTPNDSSPYELYTNAYALDGGCVGNIPLKNVSILLETERTEFLKKKKDHTVN